MTIRPRRVEKPWGYELIWAETELYVAKILHVNAGEALSVQMHEQKEETLHLLSGQLILQVGLSPDDLEPVPFEDDEISDAWDETPEVQTVDTLESKLEEMADTAGGENEYIEIPKVDLSKVIASNAEVHEEIDNDWVYQQKQIKINLFI